MAIWSNRSMLRNLVLVAISVVWACPVTQAQNSDLAVRVRRSISQGVDYLKRQQRSDGSWPSPEVFPDGGVTSLAMLALLESGVKGTDPVISAGLRSLRGVRSTDADGKESNTYVVALQTMVYSLAQPEVDRGNIEANVAWLIRAQVDRGPFSGMWGYSVNSQGGDNSNTQYALLGLHAAAEIGVTIPDEVWARSQGHFTRSQNSDGSWGYAPNDGGRGSMTVAGLSSLVICGQELHVGREQIVNGRILNCGDWSQNDPIARGLSWLARAPRRGNQFFRNPSAGRWEFYYLYGLERAARLSGQRFIGDFDWYLEGAQILTGNPNNNYLAQRLGGVWRGTGQEGNEILATSFALLFLSKGRSPVLVNKLRHDCLDKNLDMDWNNDRFDVRNLTKYISTNWRRRMTWQIVDAKAADVEGLLQAPVLFLNGHLDPVFTDVEKERLRGYIEQGGFILAEACCGRTEFDRGIREFFAELFPENPLKPLRSDHAIWKSDYVLPPDDSLEGIEFGCRTSVVYSRDDLSCYWQNEELPESLRALQLGSNIMAYATGKELLPDKLDSRKVVDLKQEGAKARWLLRVGKLKHGGDWNAAPMAIPNLMAQIRDRYDVEVQLEQVSVTPLDKNLFRIPFLYMHGRARFQFNEEQLAAIREHIDGRGTLFADSCCGQEPFDTSFRVMVRLLFPDHSFEPISPDDEMFGEQIGQGKSIGTLKYTSAMSRPEGPPMLEGVKIDGRWAVIYSKYDVGCALERHQSSDCRGYTHNAAVQIATHVLMYALLK